MCPILILKKSCYWKKRICIGLRDIGVQNIGLRGIGDKIIGLKDMGARSIELKGIGVQIKGLKDQEVTIIMGIRAEIVMEI